MSFFVYALVYLLGALSYWLYQRHFSRASNENNADSAVARFDSWWRLRYSRPSPPSVGGVGIGRTGFGSLDEELRALWSEIEQLRNDNFGAASSSQRQQPRKQQTTSAPETNKSTQWSTLSSVPEKDTPASSSSSSSNRNNRGSSRRGSRREKQQPLVKTETDSGQWKKVTSNAHGRFLSSSASTHSRRGSQDGGSPQQTTLASSSSPNNNNNVEPITTSTPSSSPSSSETSSPVFSSVDAAVTTKPVTTSLSSSASAATLLPNISPTLIAAYSNDTNKAQTLNPALLRGHDSAASASASASSTQPQPQPQQPLQQQAGEGSPSLHRHLGDVRKEGYLEIRAVKKFSRRYFVLHGCWLSYFRDEKTKRTECYGHVKLTRDCLIMPKPEKSNVLIISHSGKKPLFVSKGPSGLSAATTHRMFHATSANCVLRAATSLEMHEWIQALRKACSSCLVEASSSSSSIPTVASPLFAASLANEERDSYGGEVGSAEEVSFEDGEEISSDGEGEEEEVEAEEEREGEQREENDGVYSGDAGYPDGDEEDGRDEEEAEGGGAEEEENASQVEEQAEYPWTWPEEEARAIAILRDSLGPLGRQNDSSDPTLWRFLKARQFDVTKTAEMLEEYWKWYHEFQPYNITAEDVKPELVQNKMYFIGRDPTGRPLLLMFPGRHIPKDSNPEIALKCAVFMIETAIRNMPPGTLSFSCILDLANFGMNNMDTTFTKMAAHTLQSYYPERLGTLVCVNGPFVINMVWRIVKPMLDERTKAKINFVKNSKELLKSNFFPPECIPVFLGGTNNWSPSTPGSFCLESLQ
ncbi:X-linked retinitis pigmentosa GTPase regulator isoform X1 [Balamuthia mandrillaris]